MAEAAFVEPKKGSSSEDNKKGDTLECAICLQTCVHPAKLPCGHIFCFLCVKGIANQSKKCAMCRQEIPRDFVDQPHLLETPNQSERYESFDGGYQWFYEGRNGWWQYDERTSKELESSYKKGDRSCECLIAGFLYIVDLEGMIQMRRNEPSRKRRIKRDFASIPKKGIAGLRTEDSNGNEYLTESRNVEGRSDDNIVPVTPSNTPQSPNSGRESPSEQDLQETMQRIHSLKLNAVETYTPNTDEDD